MNSRFALILLYVIVVTFIFQYFFPAKPAVNPLAQKDIILQIQKDSLVIPNIPHVEIINNLSGAVSIKPCENISMTIDSLPYPFSDSYVQGTKFCDTIVAESGTKALIPFSEIPHVFANFSGKYIITVRTSLGERTVTFTSSKPGAVRSLLTSVIYEPIYNFFVALITFLPGHSLGWAIIIITLIIRLILLVPQHHMLVSQKKLQAIQPKIKEIQKLYKDDQAKLGVEMLNLYKKEGVNPMGSCLPLLIQMPILIGLYWVISGVTDTSNYYHLYSFFSNFNPQTISSYFYGLNLQHVGGAIGLIFSIALGIIQFIQAKLSFSYNPPVKKDEIVEKKTNETPEFAMDPAMMQNMMLYMMPVMIAFSSFFFPLGIGLYWFIGTIFVIVQQWYVNNLSKKKK